MDSDKNKPSPKERFLDLLVPPQVSASPEESVDKVLEAMRQRVLLEVKVLRGHDGALAIRDKLEEVERAAKAAAGANAVRELEKAQEACLNLKRVADNFVDGVVVPKVAKAIIEAAPGVNQYSQARTVVTQYKSRNPGGVHDPLETLEFMAVCKAFSTSQEVKRLLGLGRTRLVERVGEYWLRKFSTRQLIQRWGDHRSDVETRGDAWDMLLTGTAQLAQDTKALDKYLEKCLAHDKGYAQCFESAQSWFSMQNVQVENDFPTVVRAMLASSTNGTLWGVGKSGGKFADQIAAGPDREAAEKDPNNKSKRVVSLAAQQKSMWGEVLTQMFNCYNPTEKDWSYKKTLVAQQDTLFKAVQQVCKNFELDKDWLEYALDLLPDK